MGGDSRHHREARKQRYAYSDSTLQSPREGVSDWRQDGDGRLRYEGVVIMHIKVAMAFKIVVASWRPPTLWSNSRARLDDVTRVAASFELLDGMQPPCGRTQASSFGSRAAEHANHITSIEP